MKYRLVLLSFLCLVTLAVSGCSQESSGVAERKQEKQPPAAKRVISFGSQAYDRLWDRAGLALQEGRTVAPAGNNAVEFYLQIRQGYPELLTQKAEPSPAQKALLDTLNRLGPDVSLGIDQAVSKGDLAEASRLLRMLAAIDSEYPSLDRQVEQVERATKKNKKAKP